MASRPSGEASRLFKIFTRELGLVTAIGQGARKNHSKLRYHLRDLGVAEVALIRGREYWRLTGAVEHIWVNDILNDLAKRRAAAKVFSVLTRLIHGEEKLPALFDSLQAGFYFLAATRLGARDLARWMMVAEMRVLRHLGYWPAEPTLARVVDGADWSEEALATLDAATMARVLTLLQQALSHSHL